MSLPEEGLEKFDFYGAGYEAGGARLEGQIVARSRVLDDEGGVLCLFNFHGSKARSADVLVDSMNGPEGKGTLTVFFNSAQEARRPGRYAGAYGQEWKQTVKRRDGLAYVEIRDLAP